MIVNKNNIPIIAEEQIIQQKIKIPNNFVQLETQGRNYMCSTQGWKEPLCERYGFLVEGKWVQLDISHDLMEKLELKKGQEITYPTYISPNVLKKEPEKGGTTIDNEKDIICQKEGIVLFRENETQVDFTTGEITDLKQKLKKSEELSQETQKLLEKVLKNNEEKHIAIIFFEKQIKDLTQKIIELRTDLENETLAKRKVEIKCHELERTIKKLKEDERVLIVLQNKISDIQSELGSQITALTTERNNIQGELDNLENKFKRIRKNFLGSLLIGISRGSKKSKEIKDLEVRIARLRVQLFDKNQQIIGLNITIAAENQTINNLRQQLTNANNDKNRLNNEINNLKSQLHSIQNNYNNQIQELNKQVSNWKDDYYRKNSEINDLQRQVKYFHDQITELSPPQDVLLFSNAFFHGRDVEIGVNGRKGVELKIKNGGSGSAESFHEFADNLVKESYVAPNTCRGSKSNYCAKDFGLWVTCKKFRVRMVCTGSNGGYGQKVQLGTGWGYSDSDIK